MSIKSVVAKGDATLPVRSRRYSIEPLEQRVLLSVSASSSYLGGTSSDWGSGIAIGASGNAWVTGSTSSSGWMTGGFDTTHNGLDDAFIAKLEATGAPIWNSYLGGTSGDEGNAIAIDSSGNAW